jgi:predicted type IV restriction endonuclease
MLFLKKTTKSFIPSCKYSDNYLFFMDYTREIIQMLYNEFSNPSDEFVEYCAQRVFPKRKKITLETQEELKKITKESLDQFLEERIEYALKSISIEIFPEIEEWGEYYFVDPSRIVMREAKCYCPILLDNDKKTIFRLYFNSKQKYIGVFNKENRREIKIPICNLNEILKLADHFENIVATYDQEFYF